MSMKDKSIIIDDWAGNRLYIGPFDSPEVDKVLEANRCKTCEAFKAFEGVGEESCPECNDTGYSGDFAVSWVDEENDELYGNVYEYINY